MKLLKPLGLMSAILLANSSTLFGADLQVDVVKQSEWDSGFCANVSIYNPNSTKELWNISFNAGGLINNLWNANYSQNSATLITTASGVDWNKYVEANSNVTFGYCATKVVAPPTAPQSGDLAVTQTDNADWGSGFCKNVQVKNNTSHDIDWEVKFIVDGKVTKAWNSNYSQNSTTLEMSASGVDWNNIVKANSQVEFGYCADRVTTATPTPTPTASPSPTPTTNDLFTKFGIGFGGSYAFPFTSNTADEKIWVSSVDLVLDNNIESNEYYSNIKNFDASAFDNLQNKLKNSKFLVFWFVKGWEENWFNIDKIQEAINAGYTPVFNYWYFGDRLNGIPSESEKAEYAEDNQKVATFLNKLSGTKLLILEPEFNKEAIVSSDSNQHEFASIMSSAIDTIKSNTTGVLFSLAMMDTGNRGENQTYAKCEYDNCSLGDKYEWGRPSIVYNDLLPKLDFISFQEMVGQFSRDPSNPGDWENPNPIAYSNADIGIDNLSTRVANFTQYLKDKYNKPVFLPYIAVATATWSDANSNGSIEDSEINYSGWDSKADTLYQELSSMKTELQQKGLFGFAPMALFDDPRHDYDGYQYFMQNEYHLGVIKSGAVDGVDIATNGDISPKSNIIENLFN